MNRIQADFQHYMTTPDVVFPDPPQFQCQDRLFFRRVRAARIAADLFRRPGRALGRSHEIRVGPGTAAGRRRTALPLWVLPAVPQRRRLAAGKLSGKRFLHAAAHADRWTENKQPLTIEVQYPEGPVKAYIWRVQVGRNPLVPAGCQRAVATARRIARSRPGSTAATRTCACARKCCWASAACGRSRPWATSPRVCHMNEGHSAFLSLERIRVHHGGGETHVRRGARTGGVVQRVHHAHAGAGGQRRVPPGHHRALPGLLLSEAGAHARSSSSIWARSRPATPTSISA